MAQSSSANNGWGFLDCYSKKKIEANVVEEVKEVNEIDKLKETVVVSRKRGDSSSSNMQRIDNIHAMMSAGKTAQQLLLHPQFDELVKRLAAETSLPPKDVQQALTSGCALVSSIKHLLRVPTKEDIIEQQEDQEARRKRPNVNALGEKVSEPKILNTQARIDQGHIVDAEKQIVAQEKEDRQLANELKHVSEFDDLIQLAFDNNLVEDNPGSRKWHGKVLTIKQLLDLAAAKGWDAMHKAETNKALKTLTRDKIAEYLLSKCEGEEANVVPADQNNAALPPATTVLQDNEA